MFHNYNISKLEYSCKYKDINNQRSHQDINRGILKKQTIENIQQSSDKSIG